MDLEEIGINAGNWVDPAQDRDYWKARECGIEPQGSISHIVIYIYIYIERERERERDRERESSFSPTRIQIWIKDI